MGGSTDDTATLVLALSILSGIGVFIFSHKRVLSGVVEGKIHGATIAASVAISSITIYELLLGKTDELAVLEGISTFKTSSGGESPA